MPSNPGSAPFQPDNTFWVDIQRRSLPAKPKAMADAQHPCRISEDPAAQDRPRAG
jgi:hypothetical protein